MISVTRYHDIASGHKVFGHESKCAHLHGHGYRIHFTCISEELDKVGRVIDFSEINRILCNWLETHWDHRFLVFHNDPDCWPLKKIDDNVVPVPFNPTAENMARYLVLDIGPQFLKGTGVTLAGCKVEETPKCSATYILGNLQIGKS